MAVDASSNLDGTLEAVEEHCSFILEVLSTVEMEPSSREAMEGRVAQVLRRKNDPSLYMAAVGEFSGGKSTLINGFLRDPLLKTSAQVTTTTPTYVRHADVIGVDVQFNDSRRRPIRARTELNDNAWWRQALAYFGIRPGRINLPWLPDKVGLTTRQMIHSLTSDDTVAREVKSVTIHYPSPFLGRNIVIIDTPGSNATNPEHAEATRRVVAEDADLALIVVPATVPVSKSLVAFLEGSLRPCLHRCFFVATRVDALRPREVESVLKNIRDRLCSALNVDDVTVLPAAAQVVLDDLDPDEEVPAHLRRWVEEFEKLETRLARGLEEGRQITIVESLVRLLTQLFNELDGELRGKWEGYRAHQAAIEREIVGDLGAFARTQRIECENLVNRARLGAIDAAGSLLEDFRSDVTSCVRSMVWAAGGKGELRRVVEKDVQTVLEDKAASVPNLLDAPLSRLGHAASEVGRTFDRRFSEAYRRLETLGGSVASSALVMAPGADLGSAKPFVGDAARGAEACDNEEAGAVVLGTGVGATIGTLLLPGIGTAIFAFLGGVLGSWLSDLLSPLEEKKQEVWNQLESGLAAYHSSICNKVEAAVNDYCDKALARLKSRIDAYLSRYRVVVDEIRNQQERDLQRLEMLQAITGAYLDGITSRRDALQRQSTRLASTRFDR